MRSVLPGIRAFLLVLALALPGAVRAQEARTVSGVVVDAVTAAPVADVLVTIPSTGHRAVTDRYGRFWIEGVPAGGQDLVFRHVAYGEHTQPLVVGAANALEFRIKISSRAIELLPVVVEVMTEAQRMRRASGSSLNTIERPVLDEMSQKGLQTHNVLREIPGVHVSGACVEYRLQANTRGTRPPDEPETSLPCRGMTVYLDGNPVMEPATLLQTISPNDLERIEVLSPSEAGVRYIDGARGVILLETRRGVAPTNVVASVNVTGFGWDEEQPYRWARVLAVSTLGSAAMAGLTYTQVFECGSDRPDPWLKRGPLCGPLMGTGAAVATATIGSLITRWAGGTDVSRGRGIPAALLGTVTATAGYMLLLHGDNNDSSGARVAGQAVLAVGLPLTLTISDRVFRALR